MLSIFQVWRLLWHFRLLPPAVAPWAGASCRSIVGWCKCGTVVCCKLPLTRPIPCIHSFIHGSPLACSSSPPRPTPRRCACSTVSGARACAAAVTPAAAATCAAGASLCLLPELLAFLPCRAAALAHPPCCLRACSLLTPSTHAGSPAERLLAPIASYIQAKGGRIHTRWGCRWGGLVHHG